MQAQPVRTPEWRQHHREAALHRWYKKLTEPITSATHDMLEGLIASDASVFRPKHQAGFTLTNKFEEFTDYVAEHLTVAGFTVKRTIHKVGNRPYYCIYCNSCVDLIAYHERWYYSGKKQIPQDFIVNPRSMLYWYLGDGNLHRSGNGISVRISTYAFETKSVVRTANILSEQLHYHTAVYMTKDGPHIELSGKAAMAFLRYTGPCPVQCYNYKWNVPVKLEREKDLTLLAEYY